MANTRGRNQRVIDNSLKQKLEKIQGEMRTVVDLLERMQEENTRLIEENRVLREENNRLNGITLTPVTTPPPLVEDDSFPPPGTASETGQIINNIKKAVLSAPQSKVSEVKKEVARQGDVLIAYFYIGHSKREIYGYSIINHEILKEPTILNLIDDADNIQLYLADEKDLKGTKTYAFVIKSNATVQFPIRDVDAGDIVLWIRSNNPLDQIKKQISRLFLQKILSRMDVCNGIDREKCVLVNERVKFISQSIGEQFAHINIKQPAPNPKTVKTTVPSKVIADLTYEEYKKFVPVPKYKLLNEPPPATTDHRWIFHDYFMKGEDLDIKVEYNVPGQGFIKDSISIGQFNPESNGPHIANPYLVNKYNRTEAGTNLKDTVMYILNMVDYFHQILVLPFSSQIITGLGVDLFYGRDIGIQEHISGPTPMLTDLMHHMWDVRQGFFLIDEICSVAHDIIEREIFQETRVENTLNTNSEFKGFVDLIRAGNRRHSYAKTYVDYRKFLYHNSLHTASSSLKDNALKDNCFKKMTESERNILFSTFPGGALRNYWEIAKLCGLEDSLAYMDPGYESVKPMLKHKYEQLTGMRSLTSQERDWGATHIDGLKIGLDPNKVIAQFRGIIYRCYSDALDDLDHNETLDTAGLLIPDDTKWYSYMLNQLILVDVDKTGENWTARKSRLKLLQLINTKLFEHVTNGLEARYNSLKENAEKKHISREPGSMGNKEFYIWDDIVKFIDATGPQNGPRDWINVIPGLLPNTEPIQINDKYVIHSLSDLDWMILGMLKELEMDKNSDTY